MTFLMFFFPSRSFHPALQANHERLMEELVVREGSSGARGLARPTSTTYQDQCTCNYSLLGKLNFNCSQLGKISSWEPTSDELQVRFGEVEYTNILIMHLIPALISPPPPGIATTRAWWCGPWATRWTRATPRQSSTYRTSQTSQGEQERENGTERPDWCRFHYIRKVPTLWSKVCSNLVIPL